MFSVFLYENLNQIKRELQPCLGIQLPHSAARAMEHNEKYVFSLRRKKQSFPA